MCSTSLATMGLRCATDRTLLIYLLRLLTTDSGEQAPQLQRMLGCIWGASRLPARKATLGNTRSTGDLRLPEAFCLQRLDDVGDLGHARIMRSRISVVMPPCINLLGTVAA